METFELLRDHEIYGSIKDRVFYKWYDWYRKKHNIPRDDWNSVPEVKNFSFDVDYLNKTLHVFTDDTIYTIPLNEILSDIDQQPEIVLVESWKHYDGPLNGIGTYNGGLMYYDAHEHPDYNIRWWIAYSITQEQLDCFHAELKPHVYETQDEFNHKRWKEYIDKSNELTKKYLKNNEIGEFVYSQITKMAWRNY